MSPTGYAVLRDRRSWLGARSGLRVAPDGVLELARVPAPADGTDVVLPGPYDVAASGLALGACREVFLTDTDAARFVALDEICGSRRELPGQGGRGDGVGELRSPRALLRDGDRLYLGDAGNGRVLVHRLPDLELVGIWGPPLLVGPSGLAGDREHRVYVLDAGLRRMLRFTRWGMPDRAYNAVFETAPPGDPAFLAVADDPQLGDVLHVADAAADLVLRYDDAGAALGALPLGGPARPRALAQGGGRLYVADAATGEVWVYDLAAGDWLGTVAGYRGPVAAMAVDTSGDLVVKPGHGDRLVRLAADAGCVAAGRLVAGPFDAGLEQGWGRVAASAEARDTDARVALHLFTADDPDTGPGEWLPARGLDTLAPRAPSAPPAVGPARPDRPRRHLWLRVELTSTDRRSSPRVPQVQAETAGPGYLDGLPEIYRRADEQGFLHDWLELVRSVLGDLDAELDAMPRSFDPAVAPDEQLGRLASWLGAAPPAGITADGLRELLTQLPARYRRRGTPAGLRELLRVETGAEVTVFEDFTQRRIWILGVTSSLGLDTVLAGTDPDGLIVADEQDTHPVGGISVGRAGPLPADDWATPLFAGAAYRFRVVVPVGELAGSGSRERLQAVLDREAPAYTEHHVCVVEPRMRVGLQAGVGVDATVAGPPEPMPVTGAVLGTTTRLGAGPADLHAGPVGTAHVARDSYVE